MHQEQKRRRYLSGDELARLTSALAGHRDQQAANIVQVAGGCGRGFHPNRWGRCVPNRYGYYGPRPYWSGPYRWHSPSDNVANQLNRQELGRAYYGY